MSRYSWNTAKVGAKHQSIIQYIISMSRYSWNTAKVVLNTNKSINKLYICHDIAEILLRLVLIYKYILLVRVICEKYRLREEANFLSRLSSEGNFSCPWNHYFLQITLTNRIYFLISAEYVTAIKTVAFKQHCRLEPRNHSVFFFHHSN